jgi:hypothetical protein
MAGSRERQAKIAWDGTDKRWHIAGGRFRGSREGRGEERDEWGRDGE